MSSAAWPKGSGRSRSPSTLGERPALDKLFDQVERPVAGLSGLMKRHDAGVLELGRAAGFAQEPLGVLVAGQAARPRDLDRHHPVRARRHAPEHVAVRAGSQPLDQLELSQSVMAHSSAANQAAAPQRARFDRTAAISSSGIG